MNNTLEENLALLSTVLVRGGKNLRLIAGGLIALHHFSRNAAAGIDVNAIRLSPLPHCLGVHVIGRRGPTLLPTYFATMLDEDAEIVSQPVGVALRQIDLPLNTV